MTKMELRMAKTVLKDEPVRLQNLSEWKVGGETRAKVAAAMGALERKKLVRFLPTAGWIATDALLSREDI